MQVQPRPKVGLKLPEISLGLWHNFGGTVPLKRSREIVRRAFELGITHFDRAATSVGCSRWRRLARQAPGGSVRPRPPEYQPRRTRPLSTSQATASANDDSCSATKGTHNRSLNKPRSLRR